jgi:signal transduction histidine kinase
VKIRTQSIVLVVGIVLMPVIIVWFFIVFERASFEAREARRFEERKPLSAQGAPAAAPPRPAMREPSREPPDRRPDAPRAPRPGGPSDMPMRAEDMIRQFFADKPESMGMAVIGPDGIVVRSDVDALPVGSSLVKSLANESQRRNKDRILAFGVAPPMPAGYTAVMSLPRSDFFPTWFRDDIITVSISILVAILVFAAAMCVVIVRSITRSVLSLESATSRVAAGELDVPIAVEGSNEIASLSRSLDRLRIEVKEERSRRARFIMGISHDLKTPLALVKGYAEALDEELGGAEPSARDHLFIIQDKADQLEGMIDDLIDFERVDSGEWSRGLAEVDLGAFLRAFAKRVEADATLLGRELRSKIDLPPGAIARLDERLATRALENLVNNALRYTSAGDGISVEASASDGGGAEAFRIVVADGGPGIPPEDLPHIFEPFYRGSASRREQGMGLGLSIVKTIVESHGWKIEARSGSGESGDPKGAVFLITIPRGA